MTAATAGKPVALAPQEFVQREWEIAHANTSRVVDGVRDGGSDTGGSDLSDSLDAEWIHVRVRFVHEYDVDVADIRADRHVVFGQVGVHVPAGARIEQCVLEERVA